jgi:hypothetical protein
VGVGRASVTEAKRLAAEGAVGGTRHDESDRADFALGCGEPRL